MTIIINIMFYLGLTLLFVHSEPMIIIKRKLGFKEEEIEVYGVLKSFLTKLVYCDWCSSFWISLILSFDFKIAVITSLFMYLINKHKF